MYSAGSPTPVQADALSQFQAAADKVRAVTFFSRIKRAPITRVSLARDPGAGPWKYDPDVLRASAEAQDEPRAPDAQSPSRRVTKNVLASGEPPSEPRSPTSLTTLEFKVKWPLAADRKDKKIYRNNYFSAGVGGEVIFKHCFAARV